VSRLPQLVERRRDRQVRRGVTDDVEPKLTQEPVDLGAVDRPGCGRLERQVDEIESCTGDRAQLIGDAPPRMVHQAELHLDGFRFTAGDISEGWSRRSAHSRRRSASGSSGGAQATLLTGSHARGRARPDSDIDLLAVGDGPSVWMEVLDGRLVAVYWCTAEETRRRMLTPEEASLAVRAWRDGVLIADPTRVGEEVQREAREWTWDRIEREADAWGREQLIAQAEYLPKLSGALAAGRLLDAAALRGQLSVKLADSSPFVAA
jgi:hypothetical protein